MKIHQRNTITSFVRPIRREVLHKSRVTRSGRGRTFPFTGTRLGSPLDSLMTPYRVEVEFLLRRNRLGCYPIFKDVSVAGVVFAFPMVLSGVSDVVFRVSDVVLRVSDVVFGGRRRLFREGFDGGRCDGWFDFLASF
uniref:Uncharacterized protein n=1 Tax=Cacopsylla melanoneura TaxID=428564 RepID=A0A8D8YS43_9HEMI